MRAGEFLVFERKVIKILTASVCNVICRFCNKCYCDIVIAAIHCNIVEEEQPVSYSKASGLNDDYSTYESIR